MSYFKMISLKSVLKDSFKNIDVLYLDKWIFIYVQVDIYGA